VDLSYSLYSGFPENLPVLTWLIKFEKDTNTDSASNSKIRKEKKELF